MRDGFIARPNHLPLVAEIDPVDRCRVRRNALAVDIAVPGLRRARPAARTVRPSHPPFMWTPSHPVKHATMIRAMVQMIAKMSRLLILKLLPGLTSDSLRPQLHADCVDPFEQSEA